MAQVSQCKHTAIWRNLLSIMIVVATVNTVTMSIRINISIIIIVTFHIATIKLIGTIIDKDCYHYYCFRLSGLSSASRCLSLAPVSLHCSG